MRRLRVFRASALALVLCGFLGMTQAHATVAVISQPNLRWTISFDFSGGATPPYTLTFDTSSQLTQSSIDPTFYGYLVDYATLTGTGPTGTTITGLAPGSFGNFGGFGGTNNDNLFNPNAPYFDAGGLAFVDGNVQIFGYNGGLAACDSACGSGPEFFHPYGVSSFTVTALPEPPTWAILALGLSGLGIVSNRRRRKQTPTI